MPDSSVQEITQQAEMMRAAPNACVIANIVDMASNVMLKVLQSDSAQALSADQALSRQVLNTAVANRIKEHADIGATPVKL